MTLELFGLLCSIPLVLFGLFAKMTGNRWISTLIIKLPSFLVGVVLVIKLLKTLNLI